MQPEKKGKSSPLKEQGLRYFTPKEVIDFFYLFYGGFCFSFEFVV